MMRWRGRVEEGGGGGREDYVVNTICISVFQICLQCTLILNNRGPVLILQPELKTEIGSVFEGIESFLPVTSAKI